jgi:two-component system chemotaxis response regulator CheY
LKTILIVDDSEYMRTMIKKHIRGFELTVVGEAENGIVGVEKYKELKPDIVTMDLAMNDGDGIDAIRDILSYDPKARIIVVSSTAGQRPIIDQAVALGAREVVEKNTMDKTFAQSLGRMLAD